MDQENDKNAIDFSKKLGESTPKPQSGQWSSGSYVSPTAPKMVRWLIKHSGGLIKNERQANYVLLAFIILTIIISLFLIFGVGRSPKTLGPTVPAIKEAGSPKEIAP